MEGNLISLREVKNWLVRLVREGQKMGLRDQSQGGKIWVSETSLAGLFFTFARLVSVEVENQFLRLVSQGYKTGL